MPHVDYQNSDYTLTRRLALGNESNNGQDASFQKYGPIASQWVDDQINDVAGSLPYSLPAPDAIVALTCIQVAIMYKIEKNAPPEVIKNLQDERKTYVEGAKNAARAAPTTRTATPVAVGGSFESPFIDETMWDGTNGTLG